MRRAAGVLLRAAVKQRGVGEARAADRGPAAVAEEGGAVALLAVERQRGRARDRRIGRVVERSAPCHKR